MIAERILPQSRPAKYEISKSGLVTPLGDNPLKRLFRVKFHEGLRPDIRLDLVLQKMSENLLAHLPRIQDGCRTDLALLLGGSTHGFRAANIPLWDDARSGRDSFGNFIDDTDVEVLCSLSTAKMRMAMDEAMEWAVAKDLEVWREPENPRIQGGWKSSRWVDHSIYKVKYRYYSRNPTNMKTSMEIHLHDISANANPLETYIERNLAFYSTKLGRPVHVVLFKANGAMDQRIWRPFSLEHTGSHEVRLSRPNKFGETVRSMVLIPRLFGFAFKVGVICNNSVEISDADLEVMRGAAGRYKSGLSPEQKNDLRSRLATTLDTASHLQQHVDNKWVAGPRQDYNQRVKISSGPEWIEKTLAELGWIDALN